MIRTRGAVIERAASSVALFAPVLLARTEWGKDDLPGPRPRLRELSIEAPFVALEYEGGDGQT